LSRLVMESVLISFALIETNLMSLIGATAMRRTRGKTLFEADASSISAAAGCCAPQLSPKIVNLVLTRHHVVGVSTNP
jgi:hypothetical protein